MYDADDFALFAFSIDANKLIAAEWVNSHSYDFTEWGWDGGTNPVFNAYNDYCSNDTTVPQTYIIDADRNMRWVRVGSVGFITELTKVLNELI
jgi:hypothetical protein